MCDGNDLKITKVLSCHCEICDRRQAYIRGSVFGGLGEIKIKNGLVDIITLPQSNIFYGFYVDFPADERLILSFQSEGGGFFPHIRVVNVIESESNYFITDFLRFGPPRTINSTDGAIRAINDDVRVEIPPNSITFENGDPYDGDVEFSFTFYDPAETPVFVPTELILPGSPPEYLRSSGMMSFDLRTPDGTSLVAREAQIYLAQDSFQNNEDANGVGIYFYNVETGFWELINEMTMTGEDPLGGARRRKRQDRTFYIGGVNITVGLIYNLDVVLGPYCLLKVRIFQSEEMRIESNQLPGAEVFVVYQNADGTWANYLSRTAGPNGVCLSFPCNGDVIKGASLDGLYYNQQILSYPGPPYDEDVLGVPSSVATTFNYMKVNDNDFTLSIPPSGTTIVDDTNGPLYSSFQQCNNAAFNESHFRFYRIRPLDMETNTVDMDESAIFTPWDPTIFSWWQNRTEFVACYVKVRLNFPSRCQGDFECFSNPFPVKVMVVSRGGDHPTTMGQIYGDRQSWSIGNFACIEYKCPGPLLDGVFDRTEIEVVPLDAGFSVDEIGPALAMTDPGLNDQLGNISFTMLAPVEVTSSLGIYTASSDNPIAAKNTARLDCSVNRPDEWAVSFAFLTPPNGTIIAPSSTVLI